MPSNPVFFAEFCLSFGLILCRQLMYLLIKEGQRQYGTAPLASSVIFLWLVHLCASDLALCSKHALVESAQILEERLLGDGLGVIVPLQVADLF